MRMILAVVVAGVGIGSRAEAQALSVSVQGGDIYVQEAAGFQRLTQDGRNSEPARSRDGHLVAFVHADGGGQGYPDTVPNSLHLCNLLTGGCRILVSPRQAEAPQNNLMDITDPQFSYQAGAGPGGAIRGSVFFEAAAWATSPAIHRVTLAPDPRVTFVTDATDYRVVSGGPFAGALNVSQHTYRPAGGACESNAILDPNTGKILKKLPGEC